MIQDALNLLGICVRDKVTNFEGVVSSVCFDLYGCVQCIVVPGLDKEGKLKDAQWFDISRLLVLPGPGRVMPVPEFTLRDLHGPAEKPHRNF